MSGDTIPEQYSRERMTSYTWFGNDAKLTDLPEEFQDAIKASAAGKSNLNYDLAVGSATMGYGFCADPTYRQMTYCACVNAPVADPECVFSYCANYETSYKNPQMFATMANASKECPNVINCTEVFQMGGSSNIATGVSQTMNCGGIVETFLTTIATHPLIMMVIFILVISVAMLIATPAGTKPAQPRTP